MTAGHINGKPSALLRAFAILRNPAAEWARIAREDPTISQVFVGYVFPLSVLGPLASFVGGELFGFQGYGFTGQLDTLHAAIGIVVAYALALICFMILTLIAESLSLRYGGEPNVSRSYRLVAYAMTPVWLVGLLTIVPQGVYFGFLSLYSIHLMRTGVGPMLSVPQDKAWRYTIAFMVCGILLDVAVMVLSTLNMRILAGMGLLG